jgi:hypothetical protein
VRSIEGEAALKAVAGDKPVAGAKPVLSAKTNGSVDLIGKALVSKTSGVKYLL